MMYYFLHVALFALFASGNLSATNEDKPKISICPSPAATEEQRLKKTREYVAQLTKEDAVVLKSFDDLVIELNNAYLREQSLNLEGMNKILDAVEFAAQKHQSQTRKNKAKTPYISHPIGVAYNLMHYGEIRDDKMIVAALLHDTVSQAKVTFEEIEKAFDKEVASYVRELTDDQSLTGNALKRLQLIQAPKKSKGAAQIKLADNLYNIMELLQNPPEEWSRERIERYYQWTQAVIDRLPDENVKLKNAVQNHINSYWEKQSESSKG